MATSGSNVTLKLLIDTQSKKVLFAEAGKELVDFLFSLLSLPLATVTRLLTTHSMVGSVANLYHSIDTLTEPYLQSTVAAQSLLKPPESTSASSPALQILPDDVDCRTPPPPVPKKFYRCPYDSYYSNRCNQNPCITEVYDTVCPRCSKRMTTEVTCVGGRAVAKPVVPAGEGGFVKGVVTYMITDDLVVTPMSTISCISIINKFNIKEFGALEERNVHLDRDQGLKLLKASLQSKTVLTSVFLGD